MSCAEMLNLILKLPKVYFPWCWSDNKYGSKLLKMFLPKAKELSLTLPWRAEGHEGDGEEVGQLEAWEQISPDWRSCRGRGHRHSGRRRRGHDHHPQNPGGGCSPRSRRLRGHCGSSHGCEWLCWLPAIVNGTHGNPLLPKAWWKGRRRP